MFWRSAIKLSFVFQNGINPFALLVSCQIERSYKMICISVWDCAPVFRRAMRYDCLLVDMSISELLSTLCKIHKTTLSNWTQNPDSTSCLRKVQPYPKIRSNKTFVWKLHFYTYIGTFSRNMLCRMSSVCPPVCLSVRLSGISEVLSAN